MADQTPISSEFPFESKYVDVLGSRMHYVDVGEGDPILFLHGNPTSSYLWRNIIPHVQGLGRCIAPDLIGMGKSDRPDIPYRYDDHYRYVSAFIDELGIGSNLTLVIHDWGSGLGFRWAHDNADKVRAIAFMEAIIGSMKWEDMPREFRMAFRAMRTPGLGWLMVSGANMFIKKMLPDATHRKLSPEAQAYYASAFPTVASRKPVRQWPREVPISGKPADNVAVIEGYRKWLTTTEFPKLLFHSQPGAIIDEAGVAWCKENLSNLTAVDIGKGIHFVQEDNPQLIGTELASWYSQL
ncbi:MAG: haloalkane dehalogenase [Acidimicrobiia bacterium]|nr:haloalkane dehalogenase [Acidimicrobiia bacterium]